MRMRFLLAVLLLGAFALSAHAYRLQFKDTVGTERQYTIAFTFDAMTSVMGMTIPMKGTMTMEAVERVLAVAEGAADLSLEMKGGQMTMVMAIPGLEIDGQHQPITQPLPAGTMTYTRTPLGEMSNIKYSGEQAAELGNQFMMTDQLQQLGQTFVFPDRDINIGDTWSGKQEVEIAPGAELTIEMVYKLTGTQVVNGKTYLVLTCNYAVDITELTITPPEEVAEEEEMPDLTQLTMGIKMKGQSTTLFDEEAGGFLETTLNTMTTLSMVGEEMPMGMTINLNGKVTRVN